MYNNGYWQQLPGSNPILERRWRDIEEKGWQYAVNQKIPFRIWSEDEGYFKGGYFQDNVERTYVQDTFVYERGYNPDSHNYQGDPCESLSDNFSTGYDSIGDESNLPIQNWYIDRDESDIDYRGNQDIKAWYWMTDMPVCSFFSFQGGLRVESTDISATMKPSKGDYSGDFKVLELVERDTGGYTVDQTKVTSDEELNEHTPNLKRNDRLPALGMTVKPVENFNVRLNWSQTVARPTFKELLPVPYQESAASDIFFGNPDLEMSDIDNYDARMEFMPMAGPALLNQLLL